MGCKVVIVMEEQPVRIFYFVFLSVNLSVKRCGGAYGARITGANHVATACAIAAYITKR